MEVITRNDAILRRQTKYYTGKPCRRGHDAQRYVTTGACIKCITGYRKYIPSIAARRLAPATIPGLAPFVVYVHPDDRQVTIDFCNALVIARGLDAPAVVLPENQAERDVRVAGRIALVREELERRANAEGVTVPKPIDFAKC